MTQRIAETACRQRGARGSSKWLDVSEMAARETKLPCLTVFDLQTFEHYDAVSSACLAHSRAFRFMCLDLRAHNHASEGKDSEFVCLQVCTFCLFSIIIIIIPIKICKFVF